MLRALSSFLALMLAARSTAQTTQVSDYVSPCPNVFSYDPLAAESNKWYGVVNLTTDIPLYALWLNVVLESKANILGNWLGEVTTNDNIDFKIENTNLTITPEQPLAIRFFIQYNADATPPKLKAIRFNGREICRVEPQEVDSVPVRAIGSYKEVLEGAASITARPTVTTTSRNYNQQQTTSRNYNQQQTTSKTQYWYQTEKPQTTTNSRFWTKTTPAPATTTLKPQFWTEAQTTESTLRTQPTQYWQQTTPTLKPLFWTQAKTEDNQQTTVRTPVWSYVKPDNNQQVTSTVKLTNQTRSQARTETTTRRTTQNISVSGQVQNFPYSQTIDRNRTTNSQVQTQVPNNQQILSGNKYQVQNEIKQQITDTAPVWPSVADNQNVSSKTTRPNFQIEVKQVGNTKYWSKIPENTTGAGIKTPSGTDSTSYGWSENHERVPGSGLQNQPYAKVSIKQSESTQNFDQPKDAPLYVRPADRQTISDSRYEPKNTVENRPQPYSGIGSEYGQPVRRVDSYQETTAQGQEDTEAVRPLNLSGQTSVQRYDEGYQPWVEPARNGMGIQSGVDPLGYPTTDGRIKIIDGSDLSVGKFQRTTELPVTKQEEYYGGGLPVFYIPNFGPQSTAEPTCGKVLVKKEKGQILNSTSTYEGQWPWQIALYQQQMSVELHYKYVCGGTLISKRHVITAAHCVTKKSTVRVVNKDTLAVFVGKHNLRTTVDGVQLKFVLKILIYPEYDPTFFRTDLAILELRDAVTLSDKIQPVCLWPESDTNLRNVVGKTGSTVGWGYELTGQPRENLILLKMEVVDQQTCLNSYAEFFSKFTSDKTYCAGYRNSGTICNGDSGGGMVFQKGGTWYLRGIVSLSVARLGSYHCDPNHYVIFTDVAKFLPWIQDNVEENI